MYLVTRCVTEECMENIVMVNKSKGGKLDAIMWMTYTVVIWLQGVKLPIGRRTGDDYPNQWWPGLLMHICDICAICPRIFGNVIQSLIWYQHFVLFTLYLRNGVPHWWRPVLWPLYLQPRTHPSETNTWHHSSFVDKHDHVDDDTFMQRLIAKNIRNVTTDLIISPGTIYRDAIEVELEGKRCTCVKTIQVKWTLII